MSTVCAQESCCVRQQCVYFIAATVQNRNMQLPGSTVQDAAKPCCAVQVKRGAATVGGSAHPPTFQALYDLMGPTYPGLSVMYFAVVLCCTAHSTLDSCTNPTAFIILTASASCPVHSAPMWIQTLQVQAASIALWILVLTACRCHCVSAMQQSYIVD